MCSFEEAIDDVYMMEGQIDVAIVIVEVRKVKIASVLIRCDPFDLKTVVTKFETHILELAGHIYR
jgi:hypothetical protein